MGLCLQKGCCGFAGALRPRFWEQTLPAERAESSRKGGGLQSRFRVFPPLAAGGVPNRWLPRLCGGTMAEDRLTESRQPLAQGRIFREFGNLLNSLTIFGGQRPLLSAARRFCWADS